MYFWNGFLLTKAKFLLTGEYFYERWTDIFAEWIQIKSNICVNWVVSSVKIFPTHPVRPKAEVKNGSECHAQSGFFERTQKWNENVELHHNFLYIIYFTVKRWIHSCLGLIISFYHKTRNPWYSKTTNVLHIKKTAIHKAEKIENVVSMQSSTFAFCWQITDIATYMWLSVTKMLKGNLFGFYLLVYSLLR